MERGEHDAHDARTTRSSRRETQPTERLREDAPVYGEPINPNWRSERSTGRGRRSQSMPSSRQEFLLWLQYGGWKIIAAAGVVAALAIAFIIIVRTGGPLKPLPMNQAEPENVTLNDPLIVPEQQATTTPPPATIQIEAPPPAQGAQFQVINTGSEGLFLRPNPNTDNQVLTTLEEGAVVTIIGEDFVGPDRVWKNVRAPDGTEGWAASDWLQPVQ